jgi:hypothetical protein
MRDHTVRRKPPFGRRSITKRGEEAPEPDCLAALIFPSFALSTITLHIYDTGRPSRPMSMPSTQDRLPLLAERSPESRRTKAPGVAGNAALTAAASLLLLVLLAMEGFTVLRVRALFVPHVFLGMLLIPPILLKLTSVGYRFVRYYTGNAKYRAAGPPQLIPRLLGPFVVLTTFSLFASGVMLLVAGPGAGDVWRRLHTASFVLWFCVMSLHVLLHVWQAPGTVATDIGRARLASGPASTLGVVTRQSLVLGSLLLGVALAVTAMPLNASWLH